MDKRQLENKTKKKEFKNVLKREQKSFYKILVFCLIASVLNWIFWQDQFLGLDFKYNLGFLILPLIVGVFIFYRTNKFFIEDIRNTKPTGLKDIIFGYVFLLIIGVFFAYVSLVTIANVIFKVSMDVSSNSAPILTKTFSVESTYRNDRGRGIHLFSNVYYLDEENKIKNFRVGVNEVKTSYDKRKIIFKCKKGFWDYYKIIDYKIE